MVTQIDPISTPPTPADPPDVFEGRASQVWADLFKAVPQMNAQAQEIEAIGQAAVAAGQSAQEDSDAALGYRNESRAARDAAQGYQTAASGFSVAADVARTGAESAAGNSEDAAARSEAAAAGAESVLANAVQQTSATGAVVLPEGPDAQRPAAGSIPAGALLIRGNTQAPADYKPEFWDRAAAAWKAFADRTWVGQQITAAVTAVQAWVNQQIGFAIIYPNGGTPEVTQKVFANSRYVMTNPFPGFHVICEPEIFIDSPATDWFKPGWATNLSEGYGVSAGMYGANQIIVQTGTNGVAGAAGITGGTAQIAVQTSAYCRVKIRKIKGAV